MDAYPFSDHVLAALSRLIAQDKKRAVYKRIVTILVDRIQRMEDVLWDLHEQRWIDTAIGAQLDVLGDIVGEARQGRDDDTYRLWIRARARANRSRGTPNDALAVLRLIVEPDATLEYIDQDPRDAEYRIAVSNTAVDHTQISQITALTKPAGVQFDLQFDAGPDAFRFAPGTMGFGVGTFAGIT